MTKRHLEQHPAYLFQQEANTPHIRSCLSRLLTSFSGFLHPKKQNNQYYDSLVIKLLNINLNWSSLYKLQQDIVCDISKRTESIQWEAYEAQQFEKRMNGYIAQAANYFPRYKLLQEFKADEHYLLEFWAKATITLALREEALKRRITEIHSGNYFLEYSQQVFNSLGNHYKNHIVAELRDILKTLLLKQDTTNAELIDRMTDYIHMIIPNYIPRE